MDSKKFSGIITTALTSHRLTINAQLFHGLKNILEATGKAPIVVPNLEILLEYCSGIIASPLAQMVTLVCDPAISHILKEELASCKTIPPELVNKLRIVTEYHHYKCPIIYVLAERRDEDSLRLVDYVPITMFDYSVTCDKYCKANDLKPKLGGGKSNG